MLALQCGGVGRVLRNADTQAEHIVRHVAGRSAPVGAGSEWRPLGVQSDVWGLGAGAKRLSTHFIHSSYCTSEPVALVVTFAPTGLPRPVAPCGSNSPPASPWAILIRVRSPMPWICQYSGVLTKCAEVIVPSGMTRALLRGSDAISAGAKGGFEGFYVSVGCWVLERTFHGPHSRMQYATAISSMLPISELGSGGPKMHQSLIELRLANRAIDVWFTAVPSVARGGFVAP